MAAETIVMMETATPRRTRNMAGLAMKETKYEFLKLLRARTFSLAIIGFPVMFYAMFGLGNRREHMGGGSMEVAKYLLGGYACFGLVGAALFGIGVGLATERAAGWLELKRASPMPAPVYLLAKLLTAQAFGVLIVSVLCVLGVAFGDVRLSGRELAEMLGLTLVGVLPFAAMGLLIALVVPANAATGVVNLIYLPMSFLSGLWVPLRALPKVLQSVAPWLPTYHLSQLMLGVFGYQDASAAATHWVGLAGFTLLMLGGAWLAFARSEAAA